MGCSIKGSYSSVVALSLVAAILAACPVSGAETEISWPAWLWCFPDCVFGETCFSQVYHYCTKKEPGFGIIRCTLIALDWCDINHFNGKANRCKIPGDPCIHKEW